MPHYNLPLHRLILRGSHRFPHHLQRLLSQVPFLEVLSQVHQMSSQKLNVLSLLLVLHLPCLIIFLLKSLLVLSQPLPLSLLHNPCLLVSPADPLEPSLYLLVTQKAEMLQQILLHLSPLLALLLVCLPPSSPMVHPLLLRGLCLQCQVELQLALPLFPTETCLLSQPETYPLSLLGNNFFPSTFILHCLVIGQHQRN